MAADTPSNASMPLPLCFDGFVGRTDEIAMIRELLSEGTRVVTILGPPGVGKSRLAIEIGTEDTSVTGAQIRYCDLSPFNEATLASCLESAFLSCGTSQDTLLILDNAEHVARPLAALVHTGLSQSEHVSVLITSRKRLNLAGEVSRALGPLDAAEARRLFLDRAAAHRPINTNNPLTSAALDAVMPRLEGIPLTVELAAARLGALSLADLSERLESPAELFRNRSANAEPRHASMAHAVELSWNLLPLWAQIALAQSSVFHGSFGLKAAEAVIDLSAIQHPPAPIEVMQLLTEHSLVYTTFGTPETPTSSGSEDAKPARFATYQAIRDFVTSTPAAAEQCPAARERAVDYFLARAEAWDRDYAGSAQKFTLDDLALDVDNVLACHRYAVAERPESACRLALAVYHYARLRGRYREMSGVFDTAVVCAERCNSSLLIARSHWIRASLRINSGLLEGVEPDLTTTQELARELGEPGLEGRAALGLGAIYFRRHQGWQESAAEFRAAASSFAQADESSSEANALANLALVSLEADDLSEAHIAATRAIERMNQAGAMHRMSFPTMIAAAIAQEGGDFEAARATYHDAIDIARDLHGHLGHVAEASTHLGILECEDDRWDAAATALTRAVETYEQIGSPPEGGYALAFLAATHARRGDAEGANELVGRAKENMVSLDVRGSPLAHQLIECLVAQLLSPNSKDTLEDSRSLVAHVRREQTLPQMVRVALRLLERQILRADCGDAPGLHVGLEAAWFRVGDEARVSLGRRWVLRRLLGHLTEQRQSAPGRATTAEGMIAAGWPGESISPSSATNRLYVAIAKLRRMGLAPVLLTVNEGYLISPGSSISVEAPL